MIWFNKYQPMGLSILLNFRVRQQVMHIFAEQALSHGEN
jgi:hypothetical protein